jgi:uncharacterized iron-regulated protein
VIRRLHDSGVPLAIGLEMFGSASQGELDAWSAGRMNEGTFRGVYGRNWENIPWSYYEDIFRYARDNSIPLVGLNVPKGIVRKVYRSGFDSLTDMEREVVREPVACSTDSRYYRLITSSFRGHGNGNDAAIRLCEAQILWNRGMAKTLAEYARKNPERSIVVLAGGGHVRRKGGIPEEVGKEEMTDAVVVIPAYPPDITPGNATSDDADYLIENDSRILELLTGAAK